MMKPLSNKLTLSFFALGLFAGISTARAQVLTQVTATKLMAKSGCIACHAIDKKKMGPSYKDVAARYNAPSAEVKAYMGGKTAADYLYARVRSGVKIPEKHWKDAVGMMTANPVARISDADLKALITYILSVK